MDLKLGEQLRALPGPILITGHTGFKGTWLTFLLEHLGVSTVGYSLAPEKDCLYDRAQLTVKIPEIYADIRDVATFRKFLGTHKPSAIIHMAAQPLVLQSYKTPRETFDVNIMGTVNVLNEAFAADFVEAVIVVTTDKVYRNDNSGRAFVETDPLEGKDPYSASKVGAEAAVSAWQQIQKVSGGPKVASVRAGNVIGGGDWAADRLLPDFLRAMDAGVAPQVRSPNAIRPWQHVLEPLSGYLLLAERLFTERAAFAEAWNFGPADEDARPVRWIVERLVSATPGAAWTCDATPQPHEASHLKLDSSKARARLGWRPHWQLATTLDKTLEWHASWRRGKDMRAVTLAQITEYANWAAER